MLSSEKEESSLVDGYIQVTDEETMQATRDLARFEGIFAGFSAGANLAAAVKLLNGPEKGGSVVVLICDSGLKYLSTNLWEGS
jgi:cysteine synthase A